jgi:hypothetical protein
MKNIIILRCPPDILLVLYDLLEYKHRVPAIWADESIRIGDERANLPFSYQVVLTPLLNQLLLITPGQLVQQEGRL